MVTGKIHSFETLGALDGPGIRFIVFFAGCPLRCLFCHNPDTWDIDSGRETTADEILEKAKRYKPYFTTGGGITLSGGEPLMQPEFAGEIMYKCKEAGISTCVDTGGSILNNMVKTALGYTDLAILDVKHTDKKKYKELTGGDLELHRAFLEYCKSIKLPLWIRQVILPGWNSTEEDIYALLDYIKGANIKKIELLPYHTLGVHKWKALGLLYPLGGMKPPSEDLMSKLDETLSKASLLYST